MIRTKEDLVTNLEYIRADLHDYASCADAACQRCDDYGDGYSRGKEACNSELRAWSPHAPGCGCGPCLTVAAVVKTALSATGAVRVVAPPGVLVSVSIEVR